MSFKANNHKSRPGFQLATSSRRSMNVHENIFKALKASSFAKPNNLQLQVLPYFMDSYETNFIICAPSRSGKTTCAIIGILDQLSKSLKYTSAILLAPTYEIAETTFKCTQMLAQFCHISLHFTVGGKISTVGDKSTKEIFVGTPEKTMDFCRSSSVDFKKVGYLLVDEADCLSNPKKYFKDIVYLHQNLSLKCRTILCTSFLNSAIKEFLGKLKIYYKLIEVEIDDHECINTKQLFLVCDDGEEKLDALVYLLNSKRYKGKTIVVCERKDTLASLSAMLLSKEITSGILSSELSHTRRKNIMEKFKEGTLETLITTRSFINVLDASTITKLINYDQVLNEKYDIDINTYKKRLCVLTKTNDALAVNFIEKKWASHVFRTKDLIDGRSFYTTIEIIESGKLKTYF